MKERLTIDEILNHPWLITDQMRREKEVNDRKRKVSKKLTLRKK